LKGKLPDSLALGCQNLVLSCQHAGSERPGAFIYIGNGNSAQLHNPAYDFNDEAIPAGTSYWVRLAETALAG
jgi:metal-dependent amidase/aminoacylase/carboxypeptidase family protein